MGFTIFQFIKIDVAEILLMTTVSSPAQKFTRSVSNNIADSFCVSGDLLNDSLPISHSLMGTGQASFSKRQILHYHSPPLPPPNQASSNGFTLPFKVCIALTEQLVAFHDLNKLNERSLCVFEWFRQCF